jgi:hypothetical protein
MRRLLSLLALTTACANDYEVNAQQRILSTSYATFDASMVAVGDRETMSIYLTSTGQGAITVFDVEVDDPDHWTVTNSWALSDEDEDDESLAIDGGTDASPSYGMIEVIFKPDQEGQFRTVLTVTSNDNEVTETDDDGRGLWKVVLRGIGRYPCGNIYPTFHDFGSRAAGGYFAATTTLENCGGTILTIADFEPVGSPSFSVSTPTPIYVLPGQSEPVELAFEPAGGSPPAEAIISINGNDPDIGDVRLTVLGNDCDKSTSSGWDADHDGWFSCAGDCNDNDAAASPSAVERAANNVDDDCDGLIDEEPNSVSTDDDGDGFTETGGDCHDDDPDIHPDAIEVINQIDDDCDGHIDEDTDWSDDDLDGFSERDGDCNDDDTLIYPGATENQNEIDDDCDGQIDEGSNYFDDDFDGFAEDDPTGDHDCDDDDPWTFPGAQEDCDDRDNDCDGDIDEGEDGSPNGACSFLVERQAEPKAKEEGCSATAASGGAVLATLALIGLAIRRRED